MKPFRKYTRIALVFGLIVGSLSVSAAAESTLELYADVLKLTNSKAPFLEKFDKMLILRKKAIELENDLVNQSASGSLSFLWMKGAGSDWTKSRNISKEWITRFGNLNEPSEDPDSGMYSLYYAQCLAFFVQDKIEKSIKEGGARKTAETGLKVEKDFMAKAMKHADLARRNGSDGIDDKTARLMLASIDDVNTAVSRLVIAAEKQEADRSYHGETTEPENRVAADLQRFMERFKGGTHVFKVTNDDGGGLASTNNLILEDPKSRKRFSIGYTYGFARSLGVKVGDSVSIRFSETGEPKSIKNEANGVSHGVETWKASGFGW